MRKLKVTRTFKQEIASKSRLFHPKSPHANAGPPVIREVCSPFIKPPFHPRKRISPMLQALLHMPRPPGAAERVEGRKSKVDHKPAHRPGKPTPFIEHSSNPFPALKTAPKPEEMFHFVPNCSAPPPTTKVEGRKSKVEPRRPPTLSPCHLVMPPSLRQCKLPP